MEQQELDGLMRNIWEAMLLPGEPLEDGPARGEYDFSSCVDIVGSWNGVVSVECDESLARAFARAMFARPEGTVVEEDLIDALREVANLIGGNVKGALSSGCKLSLPRATRGNEALLLDGHQGLVCEKSFTSSGREMRVRVLSDEAQEAAA